MDLDTNIVLVTGATGWVGGRLVEVLLQGLPDCERIAHPDPRLRLRCLVLPDDDTARIDKCGGPVEIVRGDITRAEDCARFCKGAKGAIVFHTAGIIHPHRRGHFYEVNVQGTLNVLDACVATGVRRAVVVSSNSPCGTNPHADHVFDESSPYRPYMHYGRSKMLMEQGINQYRRDEKIETVIIRAPWFYGPHQPRRQSLFFRLIRDGRAPLVGGGENLRSMAYVDNLCQALILAAITKTANGRLYWIADERPYTMNEIIDTIERLLETEFDQRCVRKRMRLPGLASRTAWFIDKVLQGLGGYNQSVHVLSEMNKTIVCSIERAKLELGYLPTVALEEGMRRSLKWIWRNQGGLD